MSIRPVIPRGHPRLKSKNAKITDFASPGFRQLVQDLKDTMGHEDLIGIAAPQIAENYRVFLTQPRKTQARKSEKGDKLRVYVNPEIIRRSHEESVIYEGCGCVREKGKEFGPVLRPKEITIRARDEHGHFFTLTCDGILARVIQHEMDHLEGYEFVDRVQDPQSIISRERYIQDIKGSPAHMEASRITLIRFHKETV